MKYFFRLSMFLAICLISIPQCTFTADNSVLDRISALERRNNSWSFWAKLTGVCVAVGTFGAGYLWWKKAPVSSSDLADMEKSVTERVNTATAEVIAEQKVLSEQVQQQHQKMVGRARGRLVNLSNTILNYGDSTAAQMTELEEDVDGEEIAAALDAAEADHLVWVASVNGQMEGFEQVFEEVKIKDKINKEDLEARQTQVGSGIDSLARIIAASRQTQSENDAAEARSLALLKEAISKQRERKRKQEEEVSAQSVFVSHLLLAAKKETQELQLINGSLEATRLMLKQALYSPEPSPRSQFSPNSSPRSLNSALPKSSDSRLPRSPNHLQLGYQENNEI